MQRLYAPIALGLLAIATSSCGLGHNTRAPGTEGDVGGAKAVKMTVLASGNLEPMSALIRQAGPATVLVQITEGGVTPAKNVEIDRGSCAKPGDAAFHLAPFRGNEYQASVSNAHVAALEASPHAIVLYSSNGTQRTIYACGDLKASPVS